MTDTKQWRDKIPSKTSTVLTKIAGAGLVIFGVVATCIGAVGVVKAPATAKEWGIRTSFVRGGAITALGGGISFIATGRSVWKHGSFATVARNLVHTEDLIVAKAKIEEELAGKSGHSK